MDPNIKTASADVNDIGVVVDNFNWHHYLPLMKPTISLLVVVTSLPTMLLATSTTPNVFVVIGALIGTFLASASASVFNHVLDSDIDIQMRRTSRRPVASGKVTQNAAFVFGSVLALLSIVVLYATTTPLAAAIAFAANVFYVLIYTRCLKRHTVQNIVIGGAAGSVGPLIGWAAVTGQLAWPAWALFALIFLWTPPHFWALALKYKDDYAAAKIPMLPVVKGDANTRLQIFLYSLTLLPVIASLYIFGVVGWIYMVISFGATLIFVIQAARLLKSKSNLLAMPVFHYSCLYLFFVFGSIAIDKIILG